MAIPLSRNAFVLLDDESSSSSSEPAVEQSGRSKERRRADKADKNRAQAKAAGGAAAARPVFTPPERVPHALADYMDDDGVSLAEWGTDSEYATVSSSSAAPRSPSSYRVRITNTAAAATSAKASTASAKPPSDAAQLSVSAFRSQAAANALIRRGRRHRVRYYPSLPADAGVDASLLGTDNANAIRITVEPNGKNSSPLDRAKHAELVRPFTRHLSSGARQVEAARLFLLNLLGPAFVKTAEGRRILSLAPSRLQVFTCAGADVSSAQASVDDDAAMVVEEKQSAPRLRLLAGANIKSDATTKKLIVEICFDNASACAAVEKAVRAALGLHTASVVAVEPAPALWFRFRFRMAEMESVEDAYKLLAAAGIPRDGCVVANADKGCFAPSGRRFLYAPDVYARSGYESALGHPSLRAALVQIQMSPPPMCRSCGTLGVTSRNCRNKRCVSELRAGAVGRSLCFRCGVLADSAHHRSCKAKDVASLCLCCGGEHFTLRCEWMRQHFADISPARSAAPVPPSANEFPPLAASSPAGGAEREDGELSAADSAASDYESDGKVDPPSPKRQRKAPSQPAAAPRPTSYARAVANSAAKPRAGGLVPLSQQRRDEKDNIIAQQARLIASLTAQVQEMQRAMGRMELMLQNLHQPGSARRDGDGALLTAVDDHDNADNEWQQQRRRSRKQRRPPAAANATPAKKKKVSFAAGARRADPSASARKSVLKRRAHSDWVTSSLRSSSDEDEVAEISEDDHRSARQNAAMSVVPPRKRGAVSRES